MHCLQATFKTQSMLLLQYAARMILPTTLHDLTAAAVCVVLFCTVPRASDAVHWCAPGTGPGGGPGNTASSVWMVSNATSCQPNTLAAVSLYLPGQAISDLSPRLVAEQHTAAPPADCTLKNATQQAVPLLIAAQSICCYAIAALR
jgi:hypothetical protein